MMKMPYHIISLCVVAVIVCIYPLFGRRNGIISPSVSERTVHIPVCDSDKVITKGSISPKDMGLDNAKDDIERYWIIYYTHAEAAKRNIPIDYSGIDSLGIELPFDAKSIKVVGSIDFKGLKLHIK